jgi:hypothetical protein
MRKLLRSVSGVAAAISIAACAQSNGSASADSARGDSAHLAVNARVAADTVTPAARPKVDTAPPIGTVGGERKESGSIPSAGHASSAKGGARVTGGPQRTPVPPRSSGCGGTFVSVTVKASALGSSNDAAALRAMSSDLLAPVRGAVGPASVSPAIRAFRVKITDPSATQRVMAQLRSSPKVENVELDECAVRISR